MRLSGPILAIDSSTDQAGVGLWGGGAEIALTWNAGRNQTVSLLDQVDRCLALAGVKPAGLAGIGVANGPGMFTSLRVGVSLAKGLAFALDLPVVGVSTLAITAEPWLGLGREVIAVVAVGRGRIVWQRFSAAGAELSPPIHGDAGDLGAELSAGEPCLIAGDVPAELATAEHAVRAGAGDRRDPLVLASLAVARFERQGPDDLTLLQPAYAHARAGAAAGD